MKKANLGYLYQFVKFKNMQNTATILKINFINLLCFCLIIPNFIQQITKLRLLTVLDFPGLSTLKTMVTFTTRK